MKNRRSFLQKTALFFSSSFMGSQGVFATNTPGQSLLLPKLEEAIYAHVIADAMGGSVENNLPEQTWEAFKDWDFNNFLPPTRKKDIEEKKERETAELPTTA